METIRKYIYDIYGDHSKTIRDMYGKILWASHSFRSGHTCSSFPRVGAALLIPRTVQRKNYEVSHSVQEVSHCARSGAQWDGCKSCGKFLI